MVTGYPYSGAPPRGWGALGDRIALFLVAFLAGAALWGGGMAALVGWGRRYAGARFFRWVNALCGVALGWFGLRVLWSTIQRMGRWFPLLGRALG